MLLGPPLRWFGLVLPTPWRLPFQFQTDNINLSRQWWLKCGRYKEGIYDRVPSQCEKQEVACGNYWHSCSSLYSEQHICMNIISIYCKNYFSLPMMHHGFFFFSIVMFGHPGASGRSSETVIISAYRWNVQSICFICPKALQESASNTAVLMTGFLPLSVPRF